LQRLGLERVDLYQVHFPGGFVSIEKLMNALADALDAGKVRAVGVSNYSAEQMRKADAVLKQRGYSLASNQVEYSLVQRSPEVDGILDACRDLDVTLIAYSPLGRGVLTGKYRPGASTTDARRFYAQFKDKTLETLLPLLEALREIGETHGKKSSQVALNWLARQSHVIPIPGAKNEEQARENAEAIGWEMSEAEIDHLDKLSRSFRVATRRWLAR
jgi:aryl-alcohol dehydrogenase-like predicted oxidoreductase